MTRPAGGLAPDPLVSIVTPAFNRERYLATAISSVLNQTFERYELIVVNDGSTDRTGSIADDFAQRYPDRIRVLHQNNAGLAGARNAAIRVARGRYLAMLDSDDVWLPHHLAPCVAHLEAHADCGLVHANFENIDEDGKRVGVPSRNWDSDPAQAWARLFVREEHVMCCTAVIRRSVVDQVGPFDLSFNRIGSEDRDLWLRIMSVSRAHFFNDVHSQYRAHSGNWSKSRDKMEKAQLLLVEKHGATAQGRQWARQARAAVWLEAGEWNRVMAHKTGLATRAYLKSLASRPSSRAAWAGLVKLAIGHSG